MTAAASSDRGASATSNTSGLANSSFPILNNGGSASVNPSWQRTLRELQVASSSLLGSGGASKSAADEAGAHSLLARNQGVDVAKLSHLSRSLEHETNGTGKISVNDNDGNRAAFGVDEYLAEHQEKILERVLTQERLATRKKAQKLVESRIQGDWNDERNRWLMEVAGQRTLGGAAPLLPASETAPPPPTSSRSSGMLAPPPTTPYAAKRATAFVNQIAPPASGSTSPLEVETVKSHVALVARLNRSSNIDPALVFAEFQRIADSGTSSPQQSAYSTAWKLLQSMACRGQNQSPVESAMGALAHFCRQFQNHITNRVRGATLAGQDTSVSHPSNSSSMASIVSSYVKLELGTTNSPWPVVYYSLRCGDAASAKDAINVASPQGENADPCIHRILSQLATNQSSASCLWDSPTVPYIPEEDCQQTLDLYQRAKTRDQGDPYLIAVLGLLSLAEPQTSVGVVNTIEDYLFGALWDAVQKANPVEEIVKLGQLIKHWGPSYFDEAEDSGGWAYALPLFAAQQHGTALTHLAEIGGPLGLLQATHLGLVLDYSGVALVDLGLTDASPSCLLTQLLVSYANQLESADAPAALEYLVRIPDKARKRKEIACLIVDSRDFELLGGTGTKGDAQERTGDGALAAHFPDTVSALLADAAGEALRRGSPRDAAELYILAGYYSSLLTLLNKQLASRLGDKPDAERTFWKQAAQRFDSVYLANGRNRAMEVLDAEGKLNLVRTLHLLMELMGFVDRLHMKDFEEALTIVDKLQLFPVSETDISAKVKQFHSLDKSLQESFSIVVMGAMESLCQAHAGLKRMASGPNASAVRQRLQELRTKARLLVIFAGLLQMDNASDTNAHVSRMEAYMM